MWCREVAAKVGANLSDLSRRSGKSSGSRSEHERAFGARAAGARAREMAPGSRFAVALESLKSGFATPSTNQPVSFIYRLEAVPSTGR